MKTKSIRRIVSAAAAMMLLCCICLSGAVAWADSTAVEDAQYGVVRVICVIDRYTLGLGTGFAVGELDDDATIIITNNHVVEDNPGQVYVTITDASGKMPATVIYRDSNHDIAILELETPISERHPLPLLSPEELTKSQDVYCLGFPGNMDDFSDKDNISSTISDLTITKGTVSNPEYSTNNTKCVLTDCAINHGNSGGPMVDEYGQVVGINTWGLDENMNCAVSIDYVMEVLDQKCLPYVVGSADGKSTESGGSDDKDGKDGDDENDNKLLIIGGAGVAVVAVVAGVAIAGRKKKERQPVYAGNAPVVQNMGSAPVARPIQPAQPIQPVQNYQPMGAAPTVNQSYQGMQPALVCVCEKGAISGQRIRDAGSIRIGRDISRCQMVFPQGTPGISKLHCQLHVSGGAIYLTDLGSSYGTYLSNGTKLTPNVPVQLRNGDRFYLASQETVISVNLQ